MQLTEETGLLILAELKKMNGAIKKVLPNTGKKIWVRAKELKMFTVWRNKEDLRQVRSKEFVNYKQDKISPPGSKKEVSSYLYDLNSIAPVFLSKDKQP